MVNSIYRSHGWHQFLVCSWGENLVHVREILLRDCNKNLDDPRQLVE